MDKRVVRNPMNPLLVSLCAQLRHPGNAVGQLGEQAAGALESMWRDNVRLTECLLETEQRIKLAVDGASDINRYGALRSAPSAGDGT